MFVLTEEAISMASKAMVEPKTALRKSLCC